MTTTIAVALVRIGRRLALAALPLLLAACATMAPDSAPKIDVVGIEPLPTLGPEFRLLVKLHIVNPSDTPLEYDGAYVEINVDERKYADGVIDARGSVPRFSEAMLSVPVTINAMAVVRQALSLASGERSPIMRYQLRGKLSGPLFHSHRFETSGELPLPASR
ncbi:MAG: LEA type 2 family protein [Hylemonella sp.]|nr:LEA type 2 family protein [Hylemonella sp.]